MNSYSKMTFPPNMDIDVDDFSSSNTNNYNDVRDHTMTSNKVLSKTISISLSEALVDYATRMECLNDIPNNVKTREPINSSQLSYLKPKKIQVSRATNHENRARIQ